jgi:hypothetical protein
MPPVTSSGALLHDSCPIPLEKPSLIRACPVVQSAAMLFAKNDVGERPHHGNGSCVISCRYRKSSANRMLRNPFRTISNKTAKACEPLKITQTVF